MMLLPVRWESTLCLDDFMVISSSVGLESVQMTLQGVASQGFRNIE